MAQVNIITKEKSSSAGKKSKKIGVLQHIINVNELPGSDFSRSKYPSASEVGVWFRGVPLVFSGFVPTKTL